MSRWKLIAIPIVLTGWIISLIALAINMVRLVELLISGEF